MRIGRLSIAHYNAVDEVTDVYDEIPDDDWEVLNDGYPGTKWIKYETEHDIDFALIVSDWMEFFRFVRRLREEN